MNACCPEVGEYPRANELFQSGDLGGIQRSFCALGIGSTFFGPSEILFQGNEPHMITVP